MEISLEPVHPGLRHQVNKHDCHDNCYGDNQHYHGRPHWRP